MNPKPSVAIVGAGRVGTALGILLYKKGYPILGVVCRSHEKAARRVAQIGGGTACDDIAEGVRGADLALLTVPDDSLVETAVRVQAAGSLRPGAVLVHTSGVHPADVMRVGGRSAKRGGGPSAHGAAAGFLSMHPIQSVADPVKGAEGLVGASYGLEGDPDAVRLGKQIVRDIGGVPLTVRPGGKALYHAAACVASNYLLALIDASLELFQEAGVAREDALAALTPLIGATAANAASLGVPDALTGPIDRGDERTVGAHLDAIRALPDDVRRARIESIYRGLGLYALDMARSKAGAPNAGHTLIERMLTEYEGHQ